MNKVQNNFAVCNQTCAIENVQNLNSKNKGKLLCGQLIQIVDKIDFDNSYLIKICVVSSKTKSYSFLSDIFKCFKKNITTVPILLWQILLSINLQNRSKIIENKNFIEFLLNLNTDDTVFVTDHNIPGICKCRIKFIKEIPDRGCGIYYGFEIIQDPNDAQSAQQFIGSADQIIFPQPTTEVTKPFLNLIDDDIPECKAVTEECDTPPLNQNLNYSNIFDIPSNLTIEKKSEIIDQLKTHLEFLKTFKPAEENLTVNSNSSNFEKEEIGGFEQFDSNNIDCYDNEEVEEAREECSSPDDNPINTIQSSPNTSSTENRLILLHIAKELSELKNSNTVFPNSIDDYNLIILIENELTDLKKRFNNKSDNKAAGSIASLNEKPIVDVRKKEENLYHTKSNNKKIVSQEITEPTQSTKMKQFTCLSCSLIYLDKIQIKLTSCGHEFCKNCFVEFVNETKFSLKCPYIDQNGIRCDTIVQEHQIEMTVSPKIFKEYSMKVQKEIIGNLPNSYCCKVENCNGIWICDNPTINSYECPICRTFNCVSCEAIHGEITCKQYQRKTLYGRDKIASNLMKVKLTADEKNAHEMIIKGHVQLDAEATTAVALTKMMPDINIEDIFWAVRQTHVLNKAQQLLQYSCELCMEVYPRNQMFSMINCSHTACMVCARAYFTERITEHCIVNCVCPFCNSPELTADIKDEENMYFSLMETTLKEILDKHIFVIFQSKVRDRCLMKDPFFKWCTTCANGYTIGRDQLAVTCPECENITCANCRKPWEEQHFGITCEQFTNWKQENNPEAQEQGVLEYLNTNGIQCPKCKVKYALSKGGCMHFTCLTCKHEFCSGCNQPISRKSNCINLDLCSKRGLHAHHPRNCLYYLRDKSIQELQNLLQRNNIAYDKEDVNPTRNCNIPIQRETPMGLVDDICNQNVGENQGGLCGIHFIEYLVDLINKSNVDPLGIMSLTDCEQELVRNGIDVPERNKANSIDVLKAKIQTDVPLMAIKI